MYTRIFCNSVHTRVYRFLPTELLIFWAVAGQRGRQKLHGKEKCTEREKESKKRERRRGWKYSGVRKIYRGNDHIFTTPF